MIDLYYYPKNASFAPHLLLREIGADFDLKLVDRKVEAQKSEEYLKLNPTGRIPVLVHDNLILFESAAICIYICELDQQSRFMPLAGDFKRPLFFQWLTYLNNTVQAEFMLYRYPEKHTNDLSGIEAIKSRQDARIGEMYALLDKELAQKRFLLGEDVTACDHFLLMLALWSKKLSRPPLSFPNLRRFMNDMLERPAVRTVCELEGVDLGPYRS